MSKEKPVPATTDVASQPASKKAVDVVHTDNSKNGYLAARRAARAKANKGAN
ncbi:hypothetical protein [Rheinheimera maricola]|uniref:Transcriptional regulator n=1 Tax=Rheinheimera maricola TaxID=2793282 RepID=A0ABS7X9E1_9GAMM|nr:hypothetical protein [Rheinheimera maricola]MBZ9612142.1 hypothetical protein [Rheinheimera maricola]